MFWSLKLQNEHLFFLFFPLLLNDNRINRVTSTVSQWIQAEGRSELLPIDCCHLQYKVHSILRKCRCEDIHTAFSHIVCFLISSDNSKSLKQLGLAFCDLTKGTAFKAWENKPVRCLLRPLGWWHVYLNQGGKFEAGKKIEHLFFLPWRQKTED